jgi:hypothetical protein
MRPADEKEESKNKQIKKDNKNLFIITIIIIKYYSILC